MHITKSKKVMEIKITAKQMLTVLYVISWIIFIGVCVEAGGIIFNAAYVLYKPIVAKYFWNGADLSALYAYDKGHFIVQIFLMTVVAVLKAFIFYLIVKILRDKKLNLSQPFNIEVVRFISSIAYLSLGIGFFSIWGVNYSEWITKQGVEMPDVQKLRIGGADVWLFMGVTLLVIAQIFKRGIEIQSENELTV